MKKTILLLISLAILLLSCSSDDENKEVCDCTYYPQNGGSYNCEAPLLAQISILSVINGSSSFVVDERFDRYKCDDPSNLTGSRTITFSVTGSGEGAFISYRDANFNEVSQVVDLPWSITVPNYNNGSYTRIEAGGDNITVAASLSEEMSYSESCSGEDCGIGFWFRVPR